MNNFTNHLSFALLRCGLVLAVCVGFGVSLSAQVVTNTADTGPGSLRQAIADAASGSTITFATNLSGQTIFLGDPLLVTNKSLTIDASMLPTGITIDGGLRIFEFSDGTTNVLTQLTLINALTPSDLGGGLGGAILNHGRLTLNNSTLANNLAPYGGALFNDTSGTMTLNNCTITQNATDVEAGALYNRGSATLNHCTIVGNASLVQYGAIYNDAGHALTLNNCIVGGNTGANGANVHNRGTLTLAGTNLLGTTNFAGGGSITGNQIIGPPQVAPLGDYGGPTLTMPPLPGSQAVDRGGPTTLTNDQRGFARVINGNPDIGAVESGNPLPGFLPIVNIVADGVDGLTTTNVSLREAIAFATNGSTITFATNLSGQTITLTSGELFVSRNLIIDASALLAGIAINGNASSRILQFASGTTNVLNSLTLTKGQATGSFPNNIGGACYVINATLTLNNSTLSSNSASFGGGIENLGTLTLNNSTLSGNSAVFGGGIDNLGTVTLNNSTLSGNSASFGGGIYILDGTITLTNSIVAGNTASVASNVFGSFSGSNNLTSGDPLLAPLGNYGGPTRTMPPLPGSPAIDAGGLTTLTNDQRGFVRPNGVASDIGAVEAYGFSTLGLADTDSDGIPDILEGPSGPYPHLIVGVNDSAADTDGDGSPDWEELFNMTDLYNASDHFRILSFAPGASFNAGTNPVFNVTLKTFPGLGYALESSPILTGFQPVTNSVFTATNSTQPLEVLLAPGQAFVRGKRN